MTTSRARITAATRRTSTSGGANGSGSSDRWVQIRMVFCFALGVVVTRSFQNASIADLDMRALAENREHFIPPPPSRSLAKAKIEAKDTAEATVAEAKTIAMHKAGATNEDKAGGKSSEPTKTQDSAAAKVIQPGGPGSNELAAAKAAEARKAKKSKGDLTNKYGVEFKVIEQLMQNETTRTAGQRFLDFAILGHAKCGTSTMMYWLAAHPEVASFEWEITVLQSKNPWDLIRRIYKGLPDGSFKRGYKSPNDVENLRVVRFYREYFPKTKLLVGIRHPVRWYESFYNYRVQNGYNMPPAETLKTRCMGGQNNVCIDRARFHVNLASFGKTNLTEAELNLFSPKSHRELDRDPHPYTPNKIYLYDTAQLGDKDPDRVNRFRQDLKEYIGLSNDLPPALHVSPGHSVNETEQAIRNARKINICDEKFVPQRKELVDMGVEIRNWLQQYFLKSPDVLVSNREHFDEIIETYTTDPCESMSTATE